MGIVGVWLTVIGYALTYTGVEHFQGNNAGFLASLGYAPTPQAAAVQQVQQSFGLFNTISSIIGFLFHAPNTPQLPNVTTSSAASAPQAMMS